MLTVSDKCTRCGICTEVCPRGIIELKPEPVILFPKLCINCGHCVAVCPCTALDHATAPLAGQSALDKPVIDDTTAIQFLRSRRSIRRYKEEHVPQEVLLKLLDIARFAPSGGNTQGLSYLVVTDRDLMRKITAATINWFETLAKNDVEWFKPYTGIISVYKTTGKDVILRDAPHLILATAPTNFLIAQSNARFSLAYTELFAPTIGLGTCWAGFVEMFAQSGERTLHQLLNLPADTAIYGAIMAGYPKYSYQRMPDRNPLKVEWR